MRVTGAQVTTLLPFYILSLSDPMTIFHRYATGDGNDLQMECRHRQRFPPQPGQALTAPCGHMRRPRQAVSERGSARLGGVARSRCGPRAAGT